MVVFVWAQLIWSGDQYTCCRYPGGLKERQAKDQHERDPVRVLYNAVYGMLPKNKLRKVATRHSFILDLQLELMTLIGLVGRG